MTQDPRSPTVSEWPLDKEPKDKPLSRKEQKKRGQLPQHEEPIGGG